MGELRSMGERRAEQIARWRGERTGRSPLSFEKVEAGDERVLAECEQRELDALLRRALELPRRADSLAELLIATAREPGSRAAGEALAEIAKAKQLLDSGAISQDEFEAIKAKLV